MSHNDEQFQQDLNTALALSLEANAMDEFKRRKNSIPLSSNSQVNSSLFVESNHNQHPSRPHSHNFSQLQEEDLISFSGIAEEPKENHANSEYTKLRESILLISTQSAAAAAAAQQQQMQIIPFKSQKVALTPEGLNDLYKMKTNCLSSFKPPTFSNINSIYNNDQYLSNSYTPAYSASTLNQNTNKFNFPPTISVDSTSSLNQVWYSVTSSDSNYSEFVKSIPIDGHSDAPVIPARNIVSLDKSLSLSSGSTIPIPQAIPCTSKKQHNSSNLIDLDVVDENSASNILETFDPLISSNRSSTEEAENSYYTDYDPFDNIYNSQYSDPLYDAVTRSDNSITSPKQSHSPQGSLEYYGPVSTITNESSQAPPLPPRNSDTCRKKIDFEKADENACYSQLPRFSNKLYENVILKKSFDKDLIAFYTMVKELRSKYLYNDEVSNIGHIVAAQFDNKYMSETSIKLLVFPSNECFSKQGSKRLTEKSVDANWLEDYVNPIIFTCDVNSSVEMILNHVMVVLEGEVEGSSENYALKTIGSQEWLASDSILSHLEFVHSNIKLEKDVKLGLFPKKDKYMKVFARSAVDDTRDSQIKIENILPKEPFSSISYDSLMILLETLETEIDKLESSASDSQIYCSLHCSGVVQGVKAICALLGSVDTIELFDAITNLKEICLNNPPTYKLKNSAISNYAQTTNIVSDDGNYSKVTLRPRKIAEEIKFRLNEVRDAVQHLLEMYSQAFHVNFSVNIPQWYTAPISITNVLQHIIVHIVALHRPPAHWKHDEYMMAVQIFHGTRYLGTPMITSCTSDKTGLYPRLTFNSWLNFDKVSVCTLPRESRLVFVIYGCVKEPINGSSNDSSMDQTTNQDNQKVTKVELGWSSIQFFDFEKKMIQGTYFLSLWPPTPDKYFCPSPARGTHPYGDYCPVLSVEIPTYGGQLVFPDPINNIPETPLLDFSLLDHNLQDDLLDTIEKDFSSSKIDKREVLWEKRYYLHAFPHALPKVLNVAHSWDFACLSDLHALIKSWSPLQPLQSLELLLPRYPDIFVRAQATKWIAKMSNDELCDYLPQLLQALKHDCYEASHMSCFLLGRSLDSPRVAHYLYWSLVHSLPGDSPQNTMEVTPNFDDNFILQARYNRRNQLMLRALLAICGEKLSSIFLAQNIMIKSLDDVAESVKVAKESTRLSILRNNVENVNQILLENPTSLPLSPGLEVTGVSSKTCNYFNSNTLPLKINFMGPDKLIIPAIFKLGDDLQQDMITLQMVRIMDKMWLKEGLDLKMVTFQCIPTGDKKGMIEMITDAETLRKIQVEWGLTGSFKDKPIAEWLAKQNPSQLEYQRAVDNFTLSCAGYSIVTYLLGICDRHNDNIMLKTSGHLFHIDFGKFLGDAQMFGNFKRDRTPFVLTSDMAFVINGGDRPTPRFHNFVDLCCKAFNIIRNNGDLILHMFALMATSGIPGVTGDAVNYVRNALMPGQSNPEASASFAKMIHVSLKSWFTQFNFFLHNLAQMRFSGDTQEGELLSFIPKIYTANQDGRINNVIVYGYQKRYDAEKYSNGKYYLYILIVSRSSSPDPASLFRSYKEFCELHQKLCLQYPLTRLHSLQNDIYFGRSNVKTVADKRLPEIRKFVQSLLQSAPEILNSDLVCTFFHPLLRDQQETDIHTKKMKDNRQLPEANICGEIKFSCHYHRGNLTIMIHHAKSLPMTLNNQEPSTYVKVYLIPDRTKITKRKTKVIKKSCFPSFMETLEYRMPIDVIKRRTVQVTVWSYDSLQENEFLGGVQLSLAKVDLSQEVVDWYRLEYLPRA